MLEVVVWWWWVRYGSECVHGAGPSVFGGLKVRVL
jgi:hypothetical protein